MQETIKRDDVIFILTGAGASQDSGIQTYRGEDGYYNNDKSTNSAEEDLHVSNLVNSNKIWERLLPLYDQIVNHEPGPTYKKLATLISESKNCMLVTQNIDGYSLCLNDLVLYSDSQNITKLNVIELHGTHKTMSCITCMKKMEITKEFIEKQLKLESKAVKCDCGGIVRPDIVLFGEDLNIYLTTKIFTFIKKKRPTKVYVVGTSLQFPYLRKIINSCKQLGAKVIHVNPVEPDKLGKNEQWVKSLDDII